MWFVTPLFSHHNSGFSVPLLLGCVLCLWSLGCQRVEVPTVADLPERVDYNIHIKPLLSDRCYHCHGPDENSRSAGLRLDTQDGLYAALEDGGYAIVPGRLGRSQLAHRIMSTDPELRMPPPESNLTLSDYEIALLARWIDQGAEWQPHWAFIPPHRTEPPTTQNTDWSTNGIDAFVLSRLERKGLSPSPEAEKTQLLRRVTFDLTGLPPTLEEIDAFLTDQEADAYEEVVDRLLASESYGERMAVEWLDVARYADTDGYQDDRERRMWPWRDWVIAAFTRNMPFDDFITWQLAGDLLPKPTQEQRLATAFNRNHMQTMEGGTIEEEFRIEYVADRTHTVGTALMGMTFECARCHDHKFDPISQKEYYQFFAFFNNIDESGRVSFFTDAVNVPTLLLADEAEQQDQAEAQTRIAAQEQRMDSLFTSDMAAFRTWLQHVQEQRQTYQALPKPVAHFTFDRLAGRQLPNSVNQNQPGTAEEGITLTEGIDSQAVHFSGDDAIIFPKVGVFTRSDPFSISMWLHATETLERGVILHRTMADLDAGSRGYEMGIEDGRLVAALTHMLPGNMIKIVAEDALPLDRWVHVALTYDGSSKAPGLKLFVDGQPEPIAIAKDHLYKDIIYERGEVNLAMGARFRGTGFKGGTADELQVFDKELTALEVLALSKQPWPDFAQLAPDQASHLFDHYVARHDTTYQRERATLERLRREAHEQVNPIPEIMVMKELDQRRPTYLLGRGVYDNPTEEVFPGTPAILPSFPDSLSQDRLGLAQWLLSPDHPLTARVTVNRFWQMYFGSGLVSTSDDFGNQGTRPTHPLLLDWLATQFIDSGWDVKALQKLIVMSATYRQNSQASQDLRALDPDNVLLARGPSHRLSAEMIRDNALAASGLLVSEIGGPSVKPYQPAGLWKEKSNKSYEQDHGDALYRRSMYTFWKRTAPHPAMLTFDAAERNVCVAKRQQTSTPMQSLILLNDPQFVEAARMLAERVIREADSKSEDRIEYAFRLLTSRTPTPSEHSVLETLYAEQLEHFSQAPTDARALMQSGEHPWDRSLNLTELAATTQLATALLNFDAVYMKR